MSAYLFVVILSAFMSFEDFILKWLPGYGYLRYVSELSLYLVFFVVIFKKIKNKEKLFRTPLDGPLIVFCEVAVLSIFLNQAFSISSIIKIKALIRYFFLYYLVVNIDLTHKKVNKLITVIIGAGIIQLLSGIIQKLSGGTLNELFAPPISQTEILGLQKHFALFTLGREPGSIYGLAGDTITYGVFMLIILSITFSKLFFELKATHKNNNLSLWFSLVFIFLTNVVIVFTFSRAAGIAAVMILCIYARWLTGDRKFLQVICIFLGITFFLITISPALMLLFEGINLGDFATKNLRFLQNLTILFNKAFVLEHSKVQRLGVLLDVTPIILANKPWFGYGPDNQQTVAAIIADAGQFLTYEWLPDYIIDAYWVGLLAYFGIVGVVVILWLFWQLYNSANIIYKTSTYQTTKKLALVVMCLVIVTLFFTFFNNVLEFRIYSFYLWLLPGLMFNLYRKEQGIEQLSDQAIAKEHSRNYIG